MRMVREKKKETMEKESARFKEANVDSLKRAHYNPPPPSAADGGGSDGCLG